MGHSFSKHDEPEHDPLTAQSGLLHDNANVTTETYPNGTSRLVQTEVVHEHNHRGRKKDPIGQLRLVIETYPPLPPTHTTRFEAANLDSRALSTRALEPFRATLARLDAPNPAVDSFLNLYTSLRTHQERHPLTDHTPLPPLNRWTAQWIVDTSREGKEPLDDEAKRKLFDELTRQTHYRHGVAAMMKRDEKIKELCNIVVFQLGPDVYDFREMVPELTEKLLKAMANASTTVVKDSAADREGNPEVIQTASRFYVQWTHGMAAKGTSASPDGSPTSSRHASRHGSRHASRHASRHGSPHLPPVEEGTSESQLPDMSRLKISSDTPGGEADDGEDEHAQKLDPKVVEAVANQLTHDLDISTDTVGRVTAAALQALNGAAIYDAIPPFSLTHLSSLCARILCRIRLHVRDPEIRVSLLKLVFDALALGVCVRTPGVVGLWTDANLCKLMGTAGSGLQNVLAATAADLAAVDLCLLKLTTAHMQEAHVAPNPAILHRLATLQGKCHIPHCRAPLVGPEGALRHGRADEVWDTTMTLQPAAFPNDEVSTLNAELAPVPTLAGIYALTQYAYSRTVVTALARHVQLAHTDEAGPKSYSHHAVDAFEEMMGRMDAYHPAPAFKDFDTE